MGRELEGRLENERDEIISLVPEENREEVRGYWDRQYELILDIKNGFRYINAVKCANDRLIGYVAGKFGISIK